MFCTREWAVHQLIYAANGCVAMEKKDVPQDSNATLDGARKVVYAVDEDGKYNAVATTGWAVEEVVTSMAVDHYTHLAQEALLRARRGESSPLEYHMFTRRLNVVTLAQATGKFQWLVKRHLKQPIDQLSPKTVRRYAEALGMELSDLSRLP